MDVAAIVSIIMSVISGLIKITPEIVALVQQIIKAIHDNSGDVEKMKMAIHEIVRPQDKSKQ